MFHLQLFLKRSPLGPQNLIKRVIITSTMEEQVTYVSALAWVSRGFAKPVPKQIEMTQEEANEMKNLPSVKKNINRNIQDLNQLDYEQEGGDYPVFTPEAGHMEEEVQGDYPFGFQDLSDDEKEDYLIKPDDVLVVAGKIEKEFSSLEIYIYEQEKNNLFVHHQLMLSAFPLSIEWLNVNLGSFQGHQAERGNYAIVSTFLTEIDIWDLDLENAVQPSITLGGEIGANNQKPKKFKNKAKKYKKGSHTDSVISLSLNKFYKNILASGSADQSIKIWDLSKEECAYTNDAFTAPVSHVQWSPVENSIVLTSAQDNIVRIFDSRFKESAPIAHKLHQNERVQGICWNINQPHQIVYTTDSGYFNMIDARKESNYVFRFQASQQSLTDTKVSLKNMAATCGEDGQVNIWDINQSSADGKPLHIGTTSSKSGKLFCLQFFEDSQILCCGNSTGSLFIWDTYQNSKIQSHFSQYK